MEIERLVARIKRIKNKDGEMESVSLFFPDLEGKSITLSESDSTEIEKLFNQIFDQIIQQKKIIEFYLEDDESDLFSEVADDIILQINSEIRQSEFDFERLIEIYNTENIN
ncbi:MAG: hypothetical protein GX367_07115 [Bacteroidales bacterium]|nr:hypothetical protein [Bacteroidales bacterium]